MDIYALLEKKIIPNKQQPITINFGNKPIIESTEIIEKPVKQIRELEPGEVDESDEESVGEMPPIRRPPVSILDKRKTSNIDRELIMERLKQQNMLLVKTNIPSQKPAMDVPAPPAPLVPKRKLVIRKEPLPIITEDTEPPLQEETELLPAIEVGAPAVEKPKRANKLKIIEQPKPLLQGEALPAAEKPKRTRKLKIIAPPPGEIDITKAMIGTLNIADRLPKEKEKIIVKAPSYYMNNRKLFVQKITDLLLPYRKELLDMKSNVSCDTQSQNTNFDLLLHQKVVRDYLNLYTPYRGLLLYHGLGAGKTCTSIAIAEGMKSNKRVFVLTPASLKMNFFNEMKKCGDEMYKKNQFWEFVSTEGHPEYVGILSRALSMTDEEIRKKGGAWLVNIQKPANFTDLSTEEQTAIDEQINIMIRSKYTDINYNGLNMKKIDMLTENKTKNPFDNSVVLIDEAHNFVSRIVNKIKKPNSISYVLYDYLMKATNAKIILLSGTPIINYPNEIGILYNILRGYIKSWTMNVTVKTSEKISTETILDMFDKANLRTYDYLEYTGNKLTITRNPFGFINVKKRGVVKGTKRQEQPAAQTRREPPRGGGDRARKTKKRHQKLSSTKGIAKRVSTDGTTAEQDGEYEIDEETEKAYRELNRYPYDGGSTDVYDKYNGVHLDEAGNIPDDVFISTVIAILKKNGLEITNTETTFYKALPDDSDTFISTFVNTETAEAKNMNLFQRRILGLTSYFRSAQEELLPRYVSDASGDIFHIIKAPMSEHQFSIYSKIRKEEADREKTAKKQKRKQQPDAEEMYNISSTYRIFSRAACNFVFPEGIVRPVPFIKPTKPTDEEEGQDQAETAEINELDFDLVPKTLRQSVDVYSDIGEENPNEEIDDESTVTYAARIERAMTDVNATDEGGKSKYLDESVLDILSPKLVKVLENLQDPENRGLHLLYSHFRTIEGIGIIRLILMANGFAEFKIRKVDTNWEIDENEEDAGKPKFVLYTGTESVEEKEIIINIYNGLWDFVPSAISARLREQYENNNLGEAIKIFMITSSGAEGINLRNTRFVHVLEPYWHMVRIEQVVGRARRICSHQGLPEDMRTVKVFLYVTTLSKEQQTDEGNIELRIRDVSRMDNQTPVTTDETLYEIAIMKQRINNQILRSIKETAVDCNLYSALKKPQQGDTTMEPQVCYGFGKIQSNQFGSYPSFEKDRDEKEGLDVRAITWKAVKVTIGGIDYAMNNKTKELYDFESYQRAVKNPGSDLVLVGTLVNESGKYRIQNV